MTGTGGRKGNKLPLPRYELDEETRAFYREALADTHASGVPFLLGGAYAFARYTGIDRSTKDLDIFVRPGDARRMLDALAVAGYTTELTFSHWLGKAYRHDRFIDVIFASGNGECVVDDDWFAHAVASDFLGHEVGLVPVEEMIWSKAFVMERERFDGADVAHLLLARAESLDWARLLRRFDSHWRILFIHLMLFGYIYPGEGHRIPASVMTELGERLRHEAGAPPVSEPSAARICRGTLLSREQYLADIRRWGFVDARLVPDGKMSQEHVEVWTDAIDGEE